jgi:hypothetical protein
MIEFSFAEIALFCWAVVATGYALKYKHEAYMAEFVLRRMIEDEKVRDELVAAYKKFEERLG